MAAAIFGIGGLILSMLLVGLWHGAALLFGLPPPSPDQSLGLSLLLGCGGIIGGLVLTVVFS